MRQDTDVARMAAALRTPSLKYRSFGNEPVRHPQPTPPPAEESAFDALGDALAGAHELAPDTVLGASEPPPPAPPEPFPPPPAYSVMPAEAPAAYSAPVPPPPEPLPPVPPPQPAQAAPRPHLPVPPAPPPLPPVPEQSLLQVLLGSQAPIVPPRPLPPVAAMAPPPAPPLPASPAPAPVPLASPPQPPLAAAPAPQPGPVLPMLAALGTGPAVPPPMRAGGTTGSSLLDALMGFGPGASAAPIHYPLLDALGEAMRGSPGDPSPRHWPAARVDLALPDLLRRVAAGVRFARSAA
jgi:hypothetical protein